MTHHAANLILFWFCWAPAVGIPLALRFGLRLDWLMAWVIGINVATFMVYAYDKWAAPRERTRVPERRLHTFALIGGSPAALLAQRVLRHKSVKRSFQVVLWAILVIQFALVCWYIWQHREPGHVL